MKLTFPCGPRWSAETLLIAVAAGIATIGGLLAVRHAAASYYERLTTHAAPELHVSREAYHFGTVRRGENVRVRIPVTNRGTARLVLMEQSRSCACLAAQPELLIRPGRTELLEIGIETARLSGDVHQAIAWWTSDPERPELRCVITGRITE